MSPTSLHIHPGETVTSEMLEPLPPPIRRYLSFSGVVGKPWISTARVCYSGKFRTGADKPWMGISARQYYTTQPAGFLWNARFKMAGLPILFGQDTYKNGHSRMLGKLLGLFKVVDGSGREVDLGTMMRYLQEMTWFPVSYLDERITWQAVDDHCAEVTFTDYGTSVSARVYVDDGGRMLSFIAQRWGDFNGNPSIQTWATPFCSYAQFAGLTLPAVGRGVWHLSSGDLTYIDVNLTEVEYNCAVPNF